MNSSFSSNGSIDSEISLEPIPIGQMLRNARPNMHVSMPNLGPSLDPGIPGFVQGEFVSSDGAQQQEMPNMMQQFGQQSLSHMHLGMQQGGVQMDSLDHSSGGVPQVQQQNSLQQQLQRQQLLEQQRQLLQQQQQLLLARQQQAVQQQLLQQQQQHMQMPIQMPLRGFDDPIPFEQFSNQQFSNQQFSNQQFSNQQFSNQQFSNQQFSNQPFSNQQLSNLQLSNQQLSNQQLSNQQESGGDGGGGDLENFLSHLDLSNA
jgi:hypothetical protein